MPLQREFKGLPDYAGLYQAGSVPIELGQVLAPVFAADDFVAPPKFFRWTGTSNAQDVVVSANPVPEGEMHRLRWIGGSVQGAVGSTGIFVPVIFHLDEHFGVSPFLLPLGTPSNNSVNKLGMTFPGTGLLLLPGMSIGFQTQVYAGAGNVTVQGIYQAQVIGI